MPWVLSYVHGVLQAVDQAARGKARNEGCSRLGVSHLMSGVEVVSCLVPRCCSVSLVQVSGGSDATVAACGCSMETVWASSSVSPAGVDASLTAVLEGGCVSLSQGETHVIDNICLQCCGHSVVSHYDVNVESE